MRKLLSSQILLLALGSSVGGACTVLGSVEEESTSTGSSYAADYCAKLTECTAISFSEDCATDVEATVEFYAEECGTACGDAAAAVFQCISGLDCSRYDSETDTWTGCSDEASTKLEECGC